MSDPATRGFAATVKVMEARQRRIAAHVTSGLAGSSGFARAVDAMEQRQRRIAEHTAAAAITNTNGLTAVAKAVEQHQRRIAEHTAAAMTNANGFTRAIESMAAAHHATVASVTKQMAAALAPVQLAAERMAEELARSAHFFAQALQRASEAALATAARTARSARRLWWSITGRDEGSNGAAWAHLREGVPLAAAPPGSESFDLPRLTAPLQPILRHGPPRRGLFPTTTTPPDAPGSHAIAC